MLPLAIFLAGATFLKNFAVRSSWNSIIEETLLFLTIAFRVNKYSKISSRKNKATTIENSPSKRRQRRSKRKVFNAKCKSLLGKRIGCGGQLGTITRCSMLKCCYDISILDNDKDDLLFDRRANTATPPAVASTIPNASPETILAATGMILLREDEHNTDIWEMITNKHACTRSKEWLRIASKGRDIGEVVATTKEIDFAGENE